jgi:hypothetical protein
LASHEYSGIWIGRSVILGLGLGIVGLRWDESEGVVFELGRLR